MSGGVAGRRGLPFPRCGPPEEAAEGSGRRLSERKRGEHDGIDGVQDGEGGGRSFAGADSCSARVGGEMGCSESERKQGFFVEVVGRRNEILIIRCFR